ncbi:Cbb3-type cytochrome c oxidase subunit CcoP2 [Planctomycetes bacterium CA13]|uniref:Cbb3-type cytochrome c oxidase subunit CcoP2 n=1 Tax=Novipirellula herctigrandis TaxID=2527986 RepID=A0A5C5Z823_9BACT|nr:Cbb3-type cytochrome c oxidase subunit CcoP2 [Planctomycetes bacterium CA13]
MKSNAETNAPQTDKEVVGHVPDDPLTGHAYDGIQEFDNPLPGWWKWMFIGSIAFALPYWAFYHGGAEGRTVHDRYDNAMAANIRLQFEEIGELKEDRETVVKFLYEPSWLRVGQTVFKTNCVSCHGADGGGIVGPNLTDEEYKNVKDIGDILTVLQNGAGGGAMPAWKNRLSTNELVLAASYAASLRGTTPGTAKQPEGRKIAPWPAAPVEEDETPEGDDAESEESGDGTT